MNRKIQTLTNLIKEEVRRQLREAWKNVDAPEQGKEYTAMLPIDSSGKYRVGVKCKYIGKSRDGEIVVTPLETVQFMNDGKTGEHSEGKQFGTTLEFLYEI